MKQYRALKIRIYPQENCKKSIDKTLGSCRALYNMMLFERLSKIKIEQNEYKIPTHVIYKTEKDYIDEFEWLKEVDLIALIQSRKSLEKTYSSFASTLKNYKYHNKQIIFPQYKKKKRHNSYKTVCINNNINIDFKTKYVSLPTIGSIKFRDEREKGFGEIISATISRTSTGKYFAALVYSSEKAYIPKKKVVDPDKVIGLDMSLRNFYIDQKGSSPKFKQNTRIYEKRLTLVQRRMNRKKLYSKNWIKAKHRVAIVHEKITNSREYFNHRLAYYLVNNYDAICIENLDLKEMSQSCNLGKSVLDVRYSEFILRLTQKADEYGTHIIKVGRYFPSSKICSVCGSINTTLTINERSWTCTHCNTFHDRDKNAAMNLKNFGLKKLGLNRSLTPVEKK